jgi:hypothetical protein
MTLPRPGSNMDPGGKPKAVPGDAVDNQNPGSPMDARPLCPSAPPKKTDTVVFGVVGGTADEPRLAYLKDPQPVTDEVLALSKPVKPTEVFRFAAPCAGSGCQHFDGNECRLVKKTVQLLPAVVDRLPPCRLRPRCRWWRQEGGAACTRCPMVVTENYQPSEQQRQVADPAVIKREV